MAERHFRRPGPSRIPARASWLKTAPGKSSPLSITAKRAQAGGRIFGIFRASAAWPQRSENTH